MSSPAERGTRPSKEKRPAPLRHHPPYGFTPEEKTAEATHPPSTLEIVSVHVDNPTRGVVAGIVDRQGERSSRGCEERLDVCFTRGIGDHSLSAPTLLRDSCNDGIQLLFAPTGYENMKTFGREAVTELSAESVIRSHPDHNCGFLCHSQSVRGSGRT